MSSVRFRSSTPSCSPPTFLLHVPALVRSRPLEYVHSPIFWVRMSRDHVHFASPYDPHYPFPLLRSCVQIDFTVGVHCSIFLCSLLKTPLEDKYLGLSVQPPEPFGLEMTPLWWRYSASQAQSCNIYDEVCIRVYDRLPFLPTSI